MNKKEPITFKGVKTGDNVYRAKKQADGTWNIETLKVSNKSVNKIYYRIEYTLSFEGTENTIQTGAAVRVHVKTLDEIYAPNMGKVKAYIQEVMGWEQRRKQERGSN